MLVRYFFSLLMVGLFANGAMAREQPNLVFMLADDCTYLDMEVYMFHHLQLL